MSEPVFDDTTERIYGRLPEHFRRVDIGQDYSLKRYIAGPSKILDEVDKLITRFDYTPPEDGGEPGDTSDLVDPRTADLEWLPWLSQLLGVNVRNQVVDEGTRNEIINTTSGYRAGTEAAIIAAVQSELVGSKSVRLRKRYTDTVPGGAWDLQVQTLQSETLFNILPPSIVVPTSARNIEMHSVPVGSSRATIKIAQDDNFYKKRAIEFKAVPEASGIGSEFGPDDGYGEDDFGIEAFGTGDDEETGATEFYFYTPFYFPLDGSDPLTTMVDVSYVSGTNDNIIVSAGIELYNYNANNYDPLGVSVGTINESVDRGDLHHITGRSEALPADATHGRWLIRLKNVGSFATVHVGHFGARKENVFQWVPRTANPVQAVIDRGAKPAGLKLWHVFSASAWDALENGGATTWDDLEALPNWVSVEEYKGN